MAKETKEADPFEILDKAAEFPAGSVLFRKVADWFNVLTGEEGLGTIPSRMRLIQIIAGLIVMIWDLEARLKRAKENKFI